MSLCAVDFNTYHSNAYLEVNERKNYHHSNTWCVLEADKVRQWHRDRGRRVTRNFLINSINVSFDRSIVGTFYSCNAGVQRQPKMNADDDDGGERQYVNIDSMEGKQTIFTLHISMAARQYRLTLVCDAYTMNKSLNFDSNKSNYIP